MSDEKKPNPCKDCDKIPSVSKEYRGWSCCCINCYDPTPTNPDDGPDNHYLVYGEIKTEVISEWNELYGKATPDEVEVSPPRGSVLLEAKAGENIRAGDWLVIRENGVYKKTGNDLGPQIEAVAQQDLKKGDPVTLSNYPDVNVIRRYEERITPGADLLDATWKAQMDAQDKSVMKEMREEIRKPSGFKPRPEDITIPEIPPLMIEKTLDEIRDERVRALSQSVSESDCPRCYREGFDAGVKAERERQAKKDEAVKVLVDALKYYIHMDTNGAEFYSTWNGSEAAKIALAAYEESLK